MRKTLLYPKLAFVNLRRNLRMVLPYLMACTGTVLMFALLLTLARDPQLKAVSGNIIMTLGFGCIVIAIFSTILILYTNSVIIRQRKREFGLYNILGMEKRHIARVLIWETLYEALISFAAGLLCSLVFSKLAQMLLLRIVGGSVEYGMRIDLGAMGMTALLFAAIFALALLKNLYTLMRAKPVELLRGANEGEREPKSKWILALLGVACLAVGYVMAIRTRDAVSAMLLFFVAVLFVIAGTYLLFTAFSIVLLKALRRRKNYYYKTKHFASVSGMLYRMKRNAAGLASICILSTMVLVTISTTVCLYLGLESTIDLNYPQDIACQIRTNSTEEEQNGVIRHVNELVDASGLEMRDVRFYSLLSFTVKRGADGTLAADGDWQNGVNLDGVATVSVLTLDDYNRLTGESRTLAPGQVLLMCDWLGDTLRINELEYAATAIDHFPVQPQMMVLGVKTCCVVVDSLAALQEIERMETGVYGENASARQINYSFDLSGTDEEKMACARKIIALGQQEGNPLQRVSSRQLAYYDDYSTSYGVLFFLGMFLGLLFIMTTVMIIYYKQVSEGMDDRERYQIMQKVGMTRGEVRSSIRSQVLTVFFLPLVTAAVHIAFAFPMITRILLAFGMADTQLFAKCTLATFGVFALLYIAVYLLTARAYYRIVGEKQTARAAD